VIWKAQSTHSNKECNCHSSDHFISPPLATHLVAQTEKEDALAILVKSMKLSEVRYVSPFDVALVHIGIGETDAAFEWLEKAYTQRATRMRSLREALFDSVRTDPRFTDLRQRVGLPL